MKWIVTGNIRYYDFVMAFKECEFVYWIDDRKRELARGDTVYIYGLEPFNRIMYRARVLERGLGYEEIKEGFDHSYYRSDVLLKNIRINKYMKLELEEVFRTPLLSFENLLDKGWVAYLEDPEDPAARARLFDYILEAEEIYRIEGDQDLSQLEKIALIKARVGLGDFKESVVQRESSCRICGLGLEDYLVVNHIKPWKNSSNSERLDVNNGILLCPNHRQLFREGWISFGDRGQIMISPHMDLDKQEALQLDEASRIHLGQDERTYMKFHRDHVFKEGPLKSENTDN